MTPAYQAQASAVIDQPCIIGAGTFTHVCEHAVICDHCVLGQNVMLAARVRLGSNVKIQNNAAGYVGVTIEEDVFLDPSCVLMNVSNPRSQVVRRDFYEKTLFRRGASVGSRRRHTPARRARQGYARLSRISGSITSAKRRRHRIRPTRF